MRGLIYILLLVTVSGWAGVTWSGKKVSIVGDSYSAFGNIHGSRNSHYPGTTDVRSEAQMWWGQVIREFGGVLETNRTSGGSEFTYQYGVCPSFENYIKNGQLGSPDIILLLGGLNDFWVHQVPETGFRTAVGKLFNCLDSEYARAEKFIILPKIHNVADFRWGLAPMYRNVIRELSVAHGYQVIDLEGYYGESEGDLDTATYPHPTLQGMNKIAKRVISRIKYGPGDFLRRYDCLETDSRSYMVTDYVPNLARTEVEMKVGFVNGAHIGTNVLYYAGGAAGAETDSGKVMSLVAYNNNLHYLNSTDGGVTSVAPKIGVPVDDMPSRSVFTCRNGSTGVSNGVQIVTARNVLRVDDAEVSRPATAVSVNADGQMVLFGMRDATNSAYYGMAVKRIYGVRVYEWLDSASRTLVRDWIPALNREGVPTLYDRVTDTCLGVYGGGRMTALNLAGPFVNEETCVEYSDLVTAYAQARDGETVAVRAPPLEPVKVVVRFGVPLDCGGFENVEVASPDGRYRLEKNGNVYTLVDTSVDAPRFVCTTASELFIPVDGMLHVRLTNILKGPQYGLFTATALDGEWTQVGEWQVGEGTDLEFAVPAPAPGAKSFFMKAVKRD